MTRPVADLVKHLWTGTGTGTITLEAAVSGFGSFPASLDGQVVSYSIEHENGAEREAGVGVYTHSGTTLTRDFVTFSNVGAPTKQPFTTGDKQVRLTALGLDVVENRATSDPGATDDISQGYIAGRSRWLNTTSGALFFCTSHTTSTAVWKQVSNLTAAELLTALKTVDGAGSGLDADLLDNLSSAAFYQVGGTDVALADGGTGASTQGGAQTALGLVPGTNVQAFNTLLAAIAGLSMVADRLIYGTGASAVALATLTAFARTLLDDADNTTARATLGVAIGSQVQAWDADLDALAALTAPATTLANALQPADLASGTITPRTGGLNFSGGSLGDVLAVDGSGNLAVSTIAAALATTSVATFTDTSGSINPTASAAINVVFLTGTLTATLTANLPAASSNTNRIFVFSRSGGGQFIFQAGSRNIRKGEVIRLISDGSTWQPIEQRRSPPQVRLTAASNELTFADSGYKITLTSTSDLTILLRDDYPTDSSWIITVEPAAWERPLTFTPENAATVSAAANPVTIPANTPYELYLYVESNSDGLSAATQVYDRSGSYTVRERQGTGARTLGPGDVNTQQRNNSGTATWTINQFVGSIFVDNLDGGVLTLSPVAGVTMTDTSIAAGKFATLIGRIGGTSVYVVEAP